MREKILLHSLHICLGVDIKVFNPELMEIHRYHTDSSKVEMYEAIQLIESVDYQNAEKNFFVLTGTLKEVFLLYRFEAFYYLFGPLKVNEIPPDNIFTEVLIENDISIKYKEQMNEYVRGLKVYSLEDIRHIIKLIHYLFTSEVIDPYLESISEYIGELNQLLIQKSLNKFYYRESEKEQSKIDYENHIIELVKKGSVKELRKALSQINMKYVPSQSGDALRSEKNYSIVVFEKLSQSAIECGMHVCDATQYRDQLMLDNEKAKGFSDVIKVRNAAVIFFTQKIGEIVHPNLSPFLMIVLEYVESHLYKNISLEQLANHFGVSKTTLNLVFKNELGITVKKYLMRQKMIDAKKLLEEDISISEISQMLGFADSSHFCKKFKKELGITPTSFRRTVKN